jgi:hypothetical protein
MVRLAIAALAAILGVCSASPAKRDVEVPPGMGFDANLAWDDSRVPNPELVALPPREFRIPGNASLVAEPSHVEASEIEKRYILGNDDRFLLVSDDYPFRVVGKIVWANGVFCTGSLIGPRHVLTARHCVPQNGMGARFSELKYPNLSQHPPGFLQGPNDSHSAPIRQRQHSLWHR